MSWHETCACKCRLDTNIYNDKQRWNSGNCRCECNELIDKGTCEDGFIRNPSMCECECDKSCDAFSQNFYTISTNYDILRSVNTRDTNTIFW